ncbi:MAG: hypothetical protein WA705_15385 [Candidatus Ozemobacteraceae bacterium]
MRKFILDFVFDEVSGESRITVDVVDDEATTLELNEAIRSGEIREEVLKRTDALFGPEVARQARAGIIGVVCLDHHPELRAGMGGVAVPTGTPAKKSIDQ